MLLVVFLILFEDLHLHGKRFIFWVWRHMMLICNLRYSPISRESQSDIVKVHSTAVLCIYNQIKLDLLYGIKTQRNSATFWSALNASGILSQSLNPQCFVFVQLLVEIKICISWLTQLCYLQFGEKCYIEQNSRLL